MIELFVATLASIFSVVNPLGAVPVYLAMTPEYTQKERNRTSRLTSIYFFLILSLFFLAGTWILGFFGISIGAMRIAGGLVIMSSGYTLLTGNMSKSGATSKKVTEEALHKEDISFAPLAMPLLSGPGSISLLITYFDEYPLWWQKGTIVGVILTMGIIVYLILRFAPLLYQFLGEAGLRALSRIMGFIVMSIGVQFIIGGISKVF
jgi:multiple antibiotic resistance protein